MPLFSAQMPLFLASGSPRRKDFLKNLGLAFTVVSSGEECSPAPGEPPLEFARRAALSKARQAIALGGPDLKRGAVLAADTVVSLGNAIFGKPDNPAHALNMLTRLNNAAHTVYSACALILPNGEEAFCHAGADVRFWNIPPAALAAYAQSEEPADKAGAYAIQGHGAFLVRSVAGSVSAVIGLPLAELVELLLDHHVIA